MVYESVTVITIAIIVVGIVVQVCALYVFTRKSFLETKLTALFINVSAANMIILLFECPLLLSSSLHGGIWPDYKIVCIMRGYVCGVASINTIITFQCLVAKTMALVKNVSPDSFYYKVLLKESTLIVYSWLYSILCMLPPLVQWSSIRRDPSGLACALDWWTQTSSNISYLIFLTMCAFCLPLGYLAWKLFRLWTYFANQEPSTSYVVNRNRQMYRRKMKMILLSSILYACLWLPYCICGFLSMAGHGDRFGDNVFTVMPSLVAKSSCIYSPITYCITNKRFRVAFLRILLCCAFRRNKVFETVPSNQVEVAMTTPYTDKDQKLNILRITPTTPQCDYS